MRNGEVAPMPEGHATVAPWIVTRNTGKMIDFLRAAFSGEELTRVPNEDGSVGHAEVRIRDFIVLLFDAKPTWPDTPALLRLFVRDVDEVFNRAIEAGAVAVTELRNAAWGDRGGRIRDPLGNIWWLVEHVEDVDPEVVAARWTEPEYLESMRYAQASLDEELSARR